jgi:hypothetical protein
VFELISFLYYKYIYIYKKMMNYLTMCIDSTNTHAFSLVIKRTREGLFLFIFKEKEKDIKIRISTHIYIIINRNWKWFQSRSENLYLPKNVMRKKGQQSSTAICVDRYNILIIIMLLRYIFYYLYSFRI